MSYLWGFSAASKVGFVFVCLCCRDKEAGWLKLPTVVEYSGTRVLYVK